MISSKPFCRLRFVLACSFLFLASACHSAGTPTLHLMLVGDTAFQVEIADTDDSRRLGLMHRESLPEGQGMLFVFEQDQRLSFWMKNTVIPLSIAYISSDGIIREIHDMTPLSLDSIRSSRSVRYALEVNQGAFEAAGIEPGDRVVLPESVQRR